MKQIAFVLVFIAAHALFVWTLMRRIRILKRCKPEDRLDHMGDRVMSIVRFFLGQGKVVERVAYQRKPGVTSFHHIWIFWGFLIISVGTIEIFFSGISGGRIDLSFIGATPYRFLKLTIDGFNVIVLAAICFAFLRRIVIKPRLIPLSPDAALILGGIGGLMITHYGFHAFHFVAAGQAEAWAVDSPLAISAHLARVFQNTPAETAHLVSEVNWWGHVLILLTFLNYLPYSKHVHIITSGPNIFTRRLGQRGILPKMNIAEAEDIEKIGIVGGYKDFTWKSMLDNFSCTECGRCSNFCPAFNTGKPLSPMHLVHDIKHEALERGQLESTLEDAAKKGATDLVTRIKAQLEEMEPLIGGRIKEETLWACTTCGACQEVCPVFIEHPEKIMLMRQNLVMLQEAVPTDLARTFKNMERNSNPWGLAPDKRLDWMDMVEGGVPTIEEKPDAEYLLWVGCAGALDDRIKKSTVSLVEVLKEGGVSFAVLGAEEGCVGDTARRAGNEMLYEMQATQNIETMNGYKVKKVITACPHCLHTIKNEYPQLGGNYETFHHTQILKQLVDSGKIQVERPAAKSMTFHDPCYLGRWNGEYDAPRALLGKASGEGSVRELDRSRQHSFCCGGGGGRMGQEGHIGDRGNPDRIKEVIASGAEAVGVACPFCTVMLEDGVKDLGAEEKVQVVDVAQVIAKSMRRKPKSDGPKAEEAKPEEAKAEVPS